MKFADFLHACYVDAGVVVDKIKSAGSKVVSAILAAQPVVDGTLDEVDQLLGLVDPAAAAYGRAVKATFDIAANFLKSNSTKNTDGSITITLHKGIVADAEKAIGGAEDWWKQAGTAPVAAPAAAPAPAAAK